MPAKKQNKEGWKSVIGNSIRLNINHSAIRYKSRRHNQFYRKRLTNYATFFVGHNRINADLGQFDR